MNFLNKMAGGYKSISSDKKAGLIRGLSFGLVAGAIFGAAVTSQVKQEMASVDQVEIASIASLENVASPWDRLELTRLKLKTYDLEAMPTDKEFELYQKLVDTGVENFAAWDEVALNTVYAENEDGSYSVDRQASEAHMQQVIDSIDLYEGLDNYIATQNLDRLDGFFAKIEKLEAPEPTSEKTSDLQKRLELTKLKLKSFDLEAMPSERELEAAKSQVSADPSVIDFDAWRSLTSPEQAPENKM